MSLTRAEQFQRLKLLCSFFKVIKMKREEISRRLERLTISISEDVRKFEEETGTCVTAIHLKSNDERFGPPQLEAVNIEIKIDAGDLT